MTKKKTKNWKLISLILVMVAIIFGFTAFLYYGKERMSELALIIAWGITASAMVTIAMVMRRI